MTLSEKRAIVKEGFLRKSLRFFMAIKAVPGYPYSAEKDAAIVGHHSVLPLATKLVVRLALMR